MSTMQRRTAAAASLDNSGHNLQKQQQQQQQQQQEQEEGERKRRNLVQTYGGAIRMGTKHVKRSAVLRLLIVPMTILLIGTFSVTQMFLNSNNKNSSSKSKRTKPAAAAATVVVVDSHRTTTVDEQQPLLSAPSKNRLGAGSRRQREEPPQQEEPQHEEPQQEEPKHEEPQQEEPQQEEAQQEDPQREEPPQQEEPPQREEPQQQQPESRQEPQPQQLQQSEQQQNSQENLPKWITDYVAWHREMRAEFPGDELFTREDAPKLLVRTCLGLCGGLHDRLGQLPWDIYVAARLKRVLLMAWQRPKELEWFMLPPNGTLSIDWRIPESEKFGFADIRRVRGEVPELFDGYPERNPGEGDFLTVGFEASMVRAGAAPVPGSNTTAAAQLAVDTKYSESRYLRHRLLGHLNEGVLESRLENEGYYRDDPRWTAADLHKAPNFGAIWNLFFRLSPAVREELVGAMDVMGLLAEDGGGGPASPEDRDRRGSIPATVPYNAVHCRVRHPKAHPKGKTVKGKNENYPADKTGLPWIEGGDRRAFALETANTALRCARAVTDAETPVYFLSDSNDLVNHVAVELTNRTYLDLHGSNASWVDPDLLNTVSTQRIVARNVTVENAHIDRQKGRDPPAYYATFVDLYLAMNAKCVVYGIGYYAAFAAKIAGNECTYLYAKEAWGEQVQKTARICPGTDTDTNGEGE